MLVAEGDIQDAEILVVKRNIAERFNKFQPVGGITDTAGITKFTISAEVIRTAARQPAPYPEGTPWFIVARMYEQVGSVKTASLKVVRSRQEALAALGVAEPAFECVE